MTRHWFAVLALGMLSACASGPTAPVRSGPSAVSVETLARPVSADTFAKRDPYRIGPYDLVNYRVQDIEGMTGELQVDAGGDMQIPMVGTVSAAGHTTAEVADEIARRLRANFVRNPQVTVNLTRIQSQFVTVDGQVTMPGVYPVIPDMTLTKAVASARGLTNNGSLRRVFVQRRIDGQTYLAIHDLQAIREGKYPDPEVYPNDVISVDGVRGRQLFRDLIQVLPSFAGPLYLLLNGN